MYGWDAPCADPPVASRRPRKPSAGHNAATASVPHLGHEYLFTQKASLLDFDGWCGELADGVLHLALRGDMVHLAREDGTELLSYVDNRVNIAWRFHMVAMVDGLMHDPWCPGPPLNLAPYLAKMFPGQKVEVTVAKGDD